MAISTAGTIKHRYQTPIANNPAYAMSANEEKDSFVVASAAADGFALVKDSAMGDGWGVGFAKLAGPTAPRTYTVPDADATLLTSAAVVTVAQGGTGLATLTANTFYVGNGTAALVAAAGLTFASGVLQNSQAISATSTDGLVLHNPTAATVGAQKWSSRLRFHGSGWKTDATAGAQDVDAIVELQPVQGAAAPTFNLAWSAAINGGSYTQMFAVTSGGQVLHAAGTISLPSITFAGDPTTGLFWGGSTGRMLASVNGQIFSSFQANVLVGFAINSNYPIGFSTDPNTTVPDVTLFRDAASILALKNGTTAQEFRVYGTTTGSKYASLKHDNTNGLLNTTQGVWKFSAQGNEFDFDISGVTKGYFASDGFHLVASYPLILGGGTLLSTAAALTNGAAAATATLTNAPSAGNPTKWVPINDNGTTRYIPAW